MHWEPFLTEPFLTYVEPSLIAETFNEYITAGGAIRIKDMTEKEIATIRLGENPYLNGPFQVLHAEVAFGLLGSQEWPCISCELPERRFRDLFLNTHNLNWAMAQVPVLNSFLTLNEKVMSMQRMYQSTSEIPVWELQHFFESIRNFSMFYEIRTVYRKNPQGFALFLGSQDNG